MEQRALWKQFLPCVQEVRTSKAVSVASDTAFMNISQPAYVCGEGVLLQPCDEDVSLLVKKKGRWQEIVYGQEAAQSVRSPV